MTASVVIVAYRSSEVIAGCLASVPDGVEIVVVSQSIDATALETQVSRGGAAATVIAAGRNRGFGAGCNLGAANARGDVVIFLNPDARFTDGACERLAATCLARDGTLVGPRLIDEDGRDVTRARNWSSASRDLATLLIPSRLLPSRWSRDIPAIAAVYRTGGEVPYVQGACMAVGRTRFLEVGGFDEEFFLFGEEEYIARRLELGGTPAVLEPRATVVHVGQVSTAKTGGFAAEQYFRSVGLRYRRSGELDANVSFARGLLRAVPLASGLLLLLLSTPARRSISYRPRETAPWCRAALRGLWCGVLRRAVAGDDPAERALGWPSRPA